MLLTDEWNPREKLLRRDYNYFRPRRLSMTPIARPKTGVSTDKPLFYLYFEWPASAGADYT
jgi:hypothetical protein